MRYSHPTCLIDATNFVGQQQGGTVEVSHWLCLRFVNLAKMPHRLSRGHPPTSIHNTMKRQGTAGRWQNLKHSTRRKNEAVRRERGAGLSQNQAAVKPPSTLIAAPVTKLPALGETKNSKAPINSSGSPKRCMGVWFMMLSIRF